MSNISKTNRASDSRLEDGMIQIVRRSPLDGFQPVLGCLWSDFDEKFRKMLLRPRTTPGTAKIQDLYIMTIQMHGVHVGDVIQMIQIRSNRVDSPDPASDRFWRGGVLFLAKTCRYAPKDGESACFTPEVQFLKLTEISPKNVT